MNQTGIEWCTHTWTPVKGCSHISPGCDYCYADSTAEGKRNNPLIQRYLHGFALESSDKALLEPLAEKKRCLVFLTSMGDIFHTEKQKSTGNRITESFIQSMFLIMNATKDRHIYQVLTKRPDRVRKLPNMDFTSNIWLGTSVESPAYYTRIPHIRNTPAQTKFLSVEPMIQQMAGHTDDRLNIESKLSGIDWIICGGESYDKTPKTHVEDMLRKAARRKPGKTVLQNMIQKEIEKRNSRKMHVTWAMQIREICQRRGIKFFFKQYGYMGSHKKHRLLPTVTIPEYNKIIGKAGIAMDDVDAQVAFIGENQNLLHAREFNEMPEAGRLIWERWKPVKAKAKPPAW